MGGQGKRTWTAAAGSGRPCPAGGNRAISAAAACSRRSRPQAAAGPRLRAKRGLGERGFATCDILKLFDSGLKRSKSLVSGASLSKRIVKGTCSVLTSARSSTTLSPVSLLAAAEMLCVIPGHMAA
eukprot:1399193-Rhodomonas_salina.1